MQQTNSEGPKVYIVCLNPYCRKPEQRCLNTQNLHDHPSECSQFYYPADQIIKSHWTSLEKYPADSLGMAVKKKIQNSKEKNYLSIAIANLRLQFQKCLKELQQKLSLIYPQKELTRCYNNVYGLQKISQSLKLKLSPTYISKLLNQNFAIQNYHSLLRINENYDELRNLMQGVGKKVLSSFEGVLQKHKSTQLLPGKTNKNAKKINYGIYKSKFIASLKIQVENNVIHFPKLQSIASFLPWIYTDNYFTQGIHEFKITSLRFPIVPNAGFTVLQERDIDTYPYAYFKSLFNREGKGFKLVQGEEIDQFIAQTTVVRLRLELCGDAKAIITDSEMHCQYECKLQERKAYRMGIYGCGWAAQILELN